MPFTKLLKTTNEINRLFLKVDINIENARAALTRYIYIAILILVHNLVIDDFHSRINRKIFYDCVINV